MRKRGLFFALAGGTLSLAAAPPARLYAAITVTATPASGPSSTVTVLPDGKHRVILDTTVTDQPTTFNVRGVAGDRIENVIVNANTPQTVVVDIRATTPGLAIQSVDLIDMGASTAHVVLTDLRTTGDVGTIRVNTVTDINVQGNLTGDIVLPPRFYGGEASLVRGIVSGRILGDILVEHGAIYILQAGLSIGTADNFSQIRTKLSLQVLMAGEIYAHIDTLANGGSGVTGLFQTTTGSFTGSLLTSAIQTPGGAQTAAILISRDLDADVTVLGDIRNHNNGLPVVQVGGKIVAGHTLRVGGSLESGAALRIVEPQGLRGQVILNASNSAGQWLGPVNVAATALAPTPRYPHASSSLGGGAVGLVPFHLHEGDCSPAPNAVIHESAAPSPTAPIRAGFYGPVTWKGAAPPIAIETRPIGSAEPWTDVTHCFTVGRDPANPGNRNTIVAIPIDRLLGGREYRVRALTSGLSALLCDLGKLINPPVAHAEALFSVTDPCPGDADGSGSVTFSDITAVLTGFGLPPEPCFSRNDVDADGSITFSDITEVLTFFGVPCP